MIKLFMKKNVATAKRKQVKYIIPCQGIIAESNFLHNIIRD